VFALKAFKCTLRSLKAFMKGEGLQGINPTLIEAAKFGLN